MLRRRISGIMLSLFLIGMLALAFSDNPAKTEPTTLVVPDDFSTIQEAINNANVGDTIFVKNGTYYENLFVNKTVNLIGENRETTIINGNRTGNVFYVVEDNVTISNLTITASQLNLWNACGIYVNSSNNAFSNNIIAENFLGIYFDKACNNNVSSNLMFNNEIAHYMTKSDNNRFEKNNLTGNLLGFSSIWSSYNIFKDNSVFENDGGAICVSHGYSYIFERNMLIDNNYGLLLDPISSGLILENSIVNNRHGIVCQGYSYDNVIISNNITGNEQGLLFHDAARTVILNNTISENKQGFAIYGGSSIHMSLEIQYNNIINNTIGLWQSEYNCGKVSQNNFINNDVQAKNEADSIILWNDDYPSSGNYWSNYTGNDYFGGEHQNVTGTDGVGDTPHVIDENNQDKYPLMGPINVFDVGIWSNTSYNVNVVSNSTISDFYFNPEEGAFLRFKVTGNGGTLGFCRVTIPKNVLWTDGIWIIHVDAEPTLDYKMFTDANSTYIYFTYEHSPRTVKIEGTHVIPEFSKTLLLLMISTLLAAMMQRRRRAREN